MCVQEYSEEFRDISSKGKRSGQIPEGAITLLNQRTVSDDLPVMQFIHCFFRNTVLLSTSLDSSVIYVPLIEFTLVKIIFL